MPTILPSQVSPSPLFFSDLWLWSMLLLPGGLKQTSLLCPQCFLVPIRHFCDWRLCALRWAARGGPASPSPRWPLAELTTQLRSAHPPNHAATSTTVTPPPLSPPRVLHQPHSSLAGLWSSFFVVVPFHCDSRPSVYLESRALPPAASWESC